MQVPAPVLWGVVRQGEGTEHFPAFPFLDPGPGNLGSCYQVLLWDETCIAQRAQIAASPEETGKISTPALAST